MTSNDSVSHKSDAKTPWFDQEFNEEIALIGTNLRGLPNFPSKTLAAIQTLFDETGRKLGVILQEAVNAGVEVAPKVARRTARQLRRVKDEACSIVLRPLTNKKKD